MLVQGVTKYQLFIIFSIFISYIFLGEDTKDKGKLYKPQSRIAPTQENLSSAERAQEYARLLAADRKPERLGKKRQKDKSNLESFKEELRQ